MAEYILLMHDDVAGVRDSAWEPYLKSLQESGSFEGGSAIGDGMCVRKHGTVPPITAHLVGYIRVNADSIDHARSLLTGNPSKQAGQLKYV